MLTNPTTYEGWLIPHSLEWYEQLSEQQSFYTYPWESSIRLTNGEMIFDEEVKQMIANKTVLDIGCGDGAFAIECSSFAKTVIGFDRTAQFIETGKRKSSSVQFVVGNSKEGLPFEKDTFDCAYNRKGPTSAYSSLTEVVKKSGQVVGVHPGDTSGKELSIWFPNFFAVEEGTPIVDKLNRQLTRSQFSSYSVEEIQSIEYLKTPIDIVKYRCFGQIKAIYDAVIETDLKEITTLFSLHASIEGLPITHSRYIVRAIV